MEEGYKVVKRTGEKVAFNVYKISAAISKAFDALGKPYHPSVMELLALRVTHDFEPKVKDGLITVEDIQDSVEKVLSECGYADVAKAYILYRKQHEKMRNINSALLNYKKLVEDYLKESDWRVKENSTVNYSVGGLILSNSGAITANYWLSEVYDEEIANAHRSCAIHLHDLSMLTGYCAGWSLKQLIKEGLGGVPGKITSAPANHLSTLCNQMVNFLGIMQNEWAGAQAFSSFDTYLAPFVKVDNLTYKETKQCVQSFVYGVNTPSRWGTQAPFTNITLDWVVPNDMKNLNALVGGKEMDFTYADCQKEMDMINKAFIEIMIEGDANGRGFQYPIPTYSITRDFDWSETENNKLLFEMTAKYGTPYFSNYINSDMEPSDVRSMCPLFGKERVLVMDDYSKEFHISFIENLYNGNKKDKLYNIILNGSIKRARLHRFDGLEFFKIKTVNGHEVIFSGNHENLILRSGEEMVVPTTELTENDYVPFNVVPLEGKGLTYQDGLMVGAYLGDGTLKDDYSVTYSLNDGNKAELMSSIIQIATEKYGAKVSTCVLDKGNEVSCVNVTVTSLMLRGLIEEYTCGGNALTKEVKVKALNRSIEFRRGIYDGMLLTDGGTKDRIYTASKALAESMSTIMMSLGWPSIIRVDERTTETTLSDNPVYIVKAYKASDMRSKYGDVFVKKNGYMWFRIAEINPVHETASVGYCFEVLEDDEPYFTLPCGMVTHNCRLRLDLRELRKKSGGFFGSGESTGSIGVVTLNMPRLAYQSADEEDFYKRLDHLMDLAARSLDLKRKVISKFLEQGLYPYTKRYLGSFNNHFSTIGLVGMNEAGLNAKWLQADMTDPRVQEFTKNVLNHMRERLSDYQEKYGDLFNLEATPAESTTYRFAKHDKADFPDIITANMNGTPYYTNSSHLPVGYTEDVFSALDIQDELQTLYTSGTVFHAFLGEKLPDWKAAANLVRKIAENYKLPYYTMSPTYSVCPDHGYLTGEQDTCPLCGKKTEVYSRITGYYRPIQNWNDGKAQEFKDRRTYVIGTRTPVVRDNSNSNRPATDVPATDTAAVQNNCTPDEPGETEANNCGEKEQAEGILLFKTPTCPNCRAAMAILDKAGVNYTPIDANEEKKLVEQYGIKQAPTLVVINGNSIEKFRGVSDIKGWLK